MLDRKNIKALLSAAVSADKKVATSYSFGDETLTYSQIQQAAAKALNEMVVDYDTLHDNSRQVFALITEAIEEVLPTRVIEQYGEFAEIRTFAQGDRPVFYQRISNASKLRARHFVTKVGLAGEYEVFKLDGRSYEIPTSAFGGACQVAFEEVLDGRITMSDVLDIVLEALDRALYIEIERALMTGVASISDGTNKRYHAEGGFDKAEFDTLLSIADSYGTGASTIYCTLEFAATMIPQEAWASNEMKNEYWRNGFLASYLGHRVVILKQSMEDVTNTKKVIDPSYAYIVPGGADKPVKVAMEGTLQMRTAENKDWSQEIHMYKKMGVAVDFTNMICVYRNTDLDVNV